MLALPAPLPDPKTDFADDMDILPISDPAVVTKMQKLAKAEFIYQVAKENPFMSQEEALRRVLEAGDIEDVDKLIQPPDPETIALTKRGAQAEVDVTESTALKLKAEAGLALSEGEKEADPAEAQLKQVKMQTSVVGLLKAKMEVGKMQTEGVTMPSGGGEGQPPPVVRPIDMTGIDQEVQRIASGIPPAGPRPSEMGEIKAAIAQLVGMMSEQAQMMMAQAQTTGQQLQSLAQAVQMQAAIMAAPNELIRDPSTGRAVGSRKVLDQTLQ